MPYVAVAHVSTSWVLLPPGEEPEGRNRCAETVPSGDPHGLSPLLSTASLCSLAAPGQARRLRLLGHLCGSSGEYGTRNASSAVQNLPVSWHTHLSCAFLATRPDVISSSDIGLQVARGSALVAESSGFSAQSPPQPPPVGCNATPLHRTGKPGRSNPRTGRNGHDCFLSRRRPLYTIVRHFRCLAKEDLRMPA